MGTAVQPKHLAVIHAYRHLYRQGLQAVNYSTPSRHVLLRILRSSFRSFPAEDFDSQKIANTLRFLRQASNTTGMEHKIVRSLMMVRYWEQPQVRREGRMLKGLSGKEIHLRKTCSNHFNSTLMLLNESLGTCLR